MTDSIAGEVLRTNEKFYEAINGSDLKSMEDVWLNGPEAKCVHPGWPMLYGWEAIRESWKNIFQGGGPHGIELSGATVTVSGGLAWVVCIEKISQKIGSDVRVGYAQSTNVFHFSDSAWKLVIHHASPIPKPRGEADTDRNLQ